MYRLIPTVVAALTVACFAGEPAIDAITRPSANVILKFTMPGQISSVLVKDGDAVKVGDTLVKLDDRAEKIQVAQLKAEAEDRTRIKAAEAQLAQKRLDLKKYEDAARGGGIRAASEMEIEHARLDVEIAILSLDLGKFQQAQNRRKYQEAEIRLNKMKLTSPIAGQVEDLAVEQGESVNALEEVLRIVDIDPLWINVAVPMSQARRLSKNDPVRVEFPDPSKTGKAITGRIIHMPAEADAASRTLRIRVEVPNNARRRAGEHVKVTFGVTSKSAARSGRAPARRHLAAATKKPSRTRIRRDSGSKVFDSPDRE